MASRPPTPFVLLFVGTGNVRRSPLAERVGAAYLADALGERGAHDIRLVSAGTQASDGAVMDADTALVLRGLGGDPDRFWAQRLSAELVASADLTLTMTRQEREDVLALAPRNLACTFTLLEAADLLQTLDGTATGSPADRARGLLPALAAARAGHRDSARDDLPDPAGQPLKRHQEVGEVIADAVLDVLGRLLGVPGPAGPTPRRAAEPRRGPVAGVRRLLSRRPRSGPR